MSRLFLLVAFSFFIGLNSTADASTYRWVCRLLGPVGVVVDVYGTYEDLSTIGRFAYEVSQVPGDQSDLGDSCRRVLRTYGDGGVVNDANETDNILRTIQDDVIRTVRHLGANNHNEDQAMRDFLGGLGGNGSTEGQNGGDGVPDGLGHTIGVAIAGSATITNHHDNIEDMILGRFEADMEEVAPNILEVYRPDVIINVLFGDLGDVIDEGDIPGHEPNGDQIRRIYEIMFNAFGIHDLGGGGSSGGSTQSTTGDGWFENACVWLFNRCRRAPVPPTSPVDDVIEEVIEETDEVLDIANDYYDDCRVLYGPGTFAGGGSSNVGHRPTVDIFEEACEQAENIFSDLDDTVGGLLNGGGTP